MLSEDARPVLPLLPGGGGGGPRRDEPRRRFIARTLFGFLGSLGRDRALARTRRAAAAAAARVRSRVLSLARGPRVRRARVRARGAAWHAPALVAALAPRVPILAALLDAFASLRALGAGFDAGAAAAARRRRSRSSSSASPSGATRGGALPRETPVVLSKLAFNVLLPAYMRTRVALTLDATPLTPGLATPSPPRWRRWSSAAAVAPFTAAANPSPLADATNWRPSRAPGRDAEAVAESVAKSIG